MTLDRGDTITAAAPPDAPDVRGLEGLRVQTFCDLFGTGSSGGAERVAAEVVGRLRRAGAEVAVVGAAPRGVPVTTSDAGLRSFPSRDLSRRTGVQLQLAPGLTRFALQDARRFGPDVLYAHSLHFQTAIAAARVARRTGVPLVTTVHVGSTDGLPSAVRAFTNVWERSVGRFIMASSDRIVAVSEAVQDHLVSLGVAPAKIHVIANGVDLDRFAPPASRPVGPTVELLFVGRLIANKGPLLFVRALAALREEGLPVHATIVGDGPERTEAERLAWSLGVSQHVEFAGQRDDVASYMRRADIFVRPSTTEGMSLAILEAMATGLPVVATDIPANAELVTPDVGRLFAVGDVPGAVAAIRALVIDADRRSAMAAAAVAATRPHSWDHCARRTGALLEEVARGSGRRR